MQTPKKASYSELIFLSNIKKRPRVSKLAAQLLLGQRSGAAFAPRRLGRLSVLGQPEG